MQSGQGTGGGVAGGADQGRAVADTARPYKSGGSIELQHSMVRARAAGGQQQQLQQLRPVLPMLSLPHDASTTSLHRADWEGMMSGHTPAPAAPAADM